LDKDDNQEIGKERFLMAIDLLTGEHICCGLSIGEGCDSCRAKYPHLLARTPEQIEAGRRNLERAVAAYSEFIDGEKSFTPAAVEELNSFNYGGDNSNRYEFVGNASEDPGTIQRPRSVQAPILLQSQPGTIQHPVVAPLRTRAREALRILIGRN